MTTTQALFSATIRQLEVAVRELGGLVPRPELVDLGSDHMVWRHKPEAKGALVAAHLKCVRIVSSLNACNAMLLAGYVQEVYALARSIDEFGEDVLFLLTPLDEGQTASRDQVRFINEYFQEEFKDVDDIVGSYQERDRVSRRKIHAALSKQDVDPSRSQSLHQLLHKTFSGYVHAAYVHTMDLFDGREYKTRGMLNTPRIDECEQVFSSYIYRAIMSVEMLALHLEQVQIDAHLHRMRDDFGAQTNCVRS